MLERRALRKSDEDELLVESGMLLVERGYSMFSAALHPNFQKYRTVNILDKTNSYLPKIKSIEDPVWFVVASKRSLKS